MQVRNPDAPISASDPTPLRNAPEHRPIADSSRLTATWRNRWSVANCEISGVIQPSGRLATSVTPHAAVASAMRFATASASLCLCMSQVWATCGAISSIPSLVRSAGVRDIAGVPGSREFGTLAMDQLSHRASPRIAAAAVSAALLLLALTRGALADDVEAFSQSHPLTVVIGYSAGGGYDLYARVLARYLGKYIPGHPTIVPENMPGAGGLRASNFLYAAASKDGSVIGTFSRSIPTMPLVTSTVNFDGRKFSFIGSMSSDTSLCLTGAKSPVKTFHDMLTTPVVMGGQYAAADSDIYARLYKNVFGAKIKLVSGYPGTNDITLGMERGEVDGICGLSWGTLKVAHADWIANNSVHILVQAALKKDVDL